MKDLVPAIFFEGVSCPNKGKGIPGGAFFGGDLGGLIIEEPELVEELIGEEIIEDVGLLKLELKLEEESLEEVKLLEIELEESEEESLEDVKLLGIELKKEEEIGELIILLWEILELLPLKLDLLKGVNSILSNPGITSTAFPFPLPFVNLKTSIGVLTPSIVVKNLDGCLPNSPTPGLNTASISVFIKGRSATPSLTGFVKSLKNFCPSISNGLVVLVLTVLNPLGIT